MPGSEVVFSCEDSTLVLMDGNASLVCQDSTLHGRVPICVSGQ